MGESCSLDGPMRVDDPKKRLRSRRRSPRCAPGPSGNIRPSIVLCAFPFLDQPGKNDRLGRAGPQRCQSLRQACRALEPVFLQLDAGKHEQRGWVRRGSERFEELTSFSRLSSSSQRCGAIHEADLVSPADEKRHGEYDRDHQDSDSQERH